MDCIVAKETRTRFVPPPTPKEDMKDMNLYIRRLNVLLPSYMDQMQQMAHRTQQMLYDLAVLVGDDDFLKNFEEQYGSTDSAGLM